MTFQDNIEAPLFFVNREEELAWLRDQEKTHIRRYTVEITGRPGIGKTSLVQEFLRRARRWGPALFGGGGEYDLDRLAYSLRENRGRDLSAVVLDNADLPEKELEEVARTVFNRKSIRALFLTNRNPRVGKQIARLDLGPLIGEARSNSSDCFYNVRRSFPSRFSRWRKDIRSQSI
jgi:hypothetical protein